MGALRRILGAVALALATACATAAPAQTVLDAETAFEISQGAIGRQTDAHVFTDQRGEGLALAGLRGRPLVVSLVFTRCATVCPITTDHLRDAVMAARAALGTDAFDVLTFGFDASGDRPERLSAFAGKHGLDLAGWHLASADPATTEAFLDDLGFSWRTAAGGFDHVTQTTILDAEGRVFRQVYGDAFPLPVFVEPLKELVLGTQTRSLAAADLWDRIAFICTVYDPARNAYRFDYGIFFGIAIGGLSLILTGFAIFRLWRSNRRAEAAARSAGARR